MKEDTAVEEINVILFTEEKMLTIIKATAMKLKGGTDQPNKNLKQINAKNDAKILIEDTAPEKITATSNTAKTEQLK